MAGFKSQGKRKRELAKLDKRRAKDQKRALRKAERAGSTVATASPPTMEAAPKLSAASSTHAGGAAPAPKPPLTLSEAVERWKATKAVKAKPRW